MVLMHKTGVYLSLGEINVTNNSYVNIDNISTDTSALSCHTNKTDCCMTDGDWHYPNGSIVEPTIGGPFLSRKGNRVIKLLHINSSESVETGNFCCIIPDSSSENQTLCANICKSE